MNMLQLFTVSIILSQTLIQVSGQETTDVESVASIIEELRRVLRQQGEELRQQGDRIHRLEGEVIRLDETNQILTEKINTLPQNVSPPKTAVTLSAALFQKIPRTCDELRNLNPFAESGLYNIDPDGLNNGDEPIQVFCNTTTGATEVSHDSENRLQVSKCSTPGCYSKTVKYDASMTQITALINLSKTCQQFFQYDCVAAPLEFRNKNNAWWNDRNGTARYAWAGDDSTIEHTCQCGLANNCSEPTLTCNCDSLAPELEMDKGYITDMSSLPVTKLNFGGIKYSSSSAFYTLGKLQCWGRHQLKDEPSSCEDLWRSGNTLSGISLLRSNKSLNAVFCDFSKLPGEPGFENKIAILSANTIDVMFHAFLTITHAAGTIRFDKIAVNDGNAFNSQIFTAPVAGIYYFSCKGWWQENYYTESSIEIRKNKMSAARSQQSTNPISAHAFLNLAAGDEISVYFPRGNLNPGTDKMDQTEFFGYLLHERSV